MALIKCPECGKENVSDTAESCPNCGYGIKAHFANIDAKEKKQQQTEKRQNLVSTIKNKVPNYKIILLAACVCICIISAIVVAITINNGRNFNHCIQYLGKHSSELPSDLDSTPIRKMGRSIEDNVNFFGYKGHAIYYYRIDTDDQTIWNIIWEPEIESYDGNDNQKFIDKVVSKYGKYETIIGEDEQHNTYRWKDINGATVDIVKRGNFNFFVNFQ